MQRHPLGSVLLLMAVGAGSLTGCAPKAGTEARGGTAGTPEPRRVDDDLLSQIEQTAADLRALSEGTPAAPPTTSVFANEPSARPRPPQANVSPALAVEPEPAAPEPVADAAATPAAEAVPGPTGADRVRRAVADLSAALRADVDADPVRIYAAMAALEIIAPGSMVNPAAIEGLTPEDARILEAWADLMREADARLTSSPSDSRALARAVLDAARTAGTFETLMVRDARLCSRVEGFGRYTTMGSTWLAGRPHKAIVYAEVEHFASSAAVGPNGERGHEVRLTQELQLFHDAEGLLAWRLPPQDVRDFSRNRRRDFFVVQMIELPSSLSVGRYQLKVTLRDEATRQTAETVIPISVVADAALLGTGNAPAAR